MTRHKQQGFSALLMIGVIVLMGGMLAFGASITNGMNSSVAVEISAVRAQQAALAGLEWGRYNITQVGPTCVATTNFVPPLSAGGTTVTVTCQALAGTTDTVAVAIYRITATACNQPLAGACPNAAATADYVQSQVTAIVYR